MLNIIHNHPFDSIQQRLAGLTKADAAAALSKAAAGGDLTPDDLLCLVSSKAAAYLEQMAELSRARTRQRFGRTLSLYIPLYLSNWCEGGCTYCGFNKTAGVRRVALSDVEICKEAAAIKAMGYDHILLVTGESSRRAGFDYILNAIRLVRPFFSAISAEVQPLSENEYRELIGAGLSAVYIYQETYNAEKYSTYHRSGRKQDFAWRLQTPDRLGLAGVHRIGLGALLGLEDWRAEAYLLAHHLRYLQRRYWQTQYSLSFPRIRPSAGGFQPNIDVSDRDLAQLIFAFRLFDSDVQMALSTRESASFRDNMLSLGITSISAGSVTVPGGYSGGFVDGGGLAQFAVSDGRSVPELVQSLAGQGLTAVWKDWDRWLGA